MSETKFPTHTEPQAKLQFCANSKLELALLDYPEIPVSTEWCAAGKWYALLSKEVPSIAV
jgi:hypothetical protein